jgi:hypothetical protein
MWARLLTKAAVLLVAAMGKAANANEPGTEINETKRAGTVLSSTIEQSGLPDATRPTNVQLGRNPRVLFITDKNSDQCRRELERLRRPRGEFAAMQAQGWKIGASVNDHIQMVDRGEVPDLLNQLDSSEFPVVACISDGEIIRSFKDGCSTPLDAWTFGWLLKGISERPQAPIPEAIRVATTGHYPLRGNHWSVDGDTNPTKETLVAHLRGPNHVHLLNADWKIEVWSTEELRSLHDDLHEKYGPPATAAAAGPARSSSSFDQFNAGRKAAGKF